MGHVCNILLSLVENYMHALLSYQIKRMSNDQRSGDKHGFMVENNLQGNFQLICIKMSGLHVQNFLYAQVYDKFNSLLPSSLVTWFAALGLHLLIAFCSGGLQMAWLTRN